MNRFCLIGYPLGHSLSPQIQQRLFALSGIDGTYELRAFAPEAFDEEWPRLREYDGFNVTIPYKQRVAPLMDALSERAARFGAVNTVVCRGGRLDGHNTAAEGFLCALNGAGIKLRGRVLLAGAGGVSSMMAHMALQSGCALHVAVRDAGKAAAFAQTLQTAYPNAEITHSTLREARGPFDLLLNGTPAGMFPHPEGCPVEPELLGQVAAVFDTIYNPLETKLLAYARAAGAKVCSGLPMLVWQAAAAQELWTGAAFSEAQVAAVCEETAGLLKANSSNC